MGGEDYMSSLPANLGGSAFITGGALDYNAIGSNNSSTRSIKAGAKNSGLAFRGSGSKSVSNHSSMPGTYRHPMMMNRDNMTSS